MFCSLGQSDVERHTLAKYLMELTLLDYSMVHYHPSQIAAAALCLAQQLLEGLQWVRDSVCGCSLSRSLPPPLHAASPCLQSRTQQHYSSYSEAQLRPIMQHIAKNVVAVNEGKTKFMVSSALLRSTEL